MGYYLNSMKKTIVINILGGPGVGKTTVASELFSVLKKKNKDVEIVSEFAKELVWEKRTEAFNVRLYMHAEQNHRLMMMNGNLDYIITDSPLILTSVYNHFYMEDKHTKDYNDMIDNVVIETWNLYNNITFLLNRTVNYETNGRRESEEEAQMIDSKTMEYIKEHNIPTIVISDRDKAVEEILKALNL